MVVWRDFYAGGYVRAKISQIAYFLSEFKVVVWTRLDFRWISVFRENGDGGIHGDELHGEKPPPPNGCLGYVKT